MLMLQSYSQMEQRALLKVSLTILLLLFVTPKSEHECAFSTTVYYVYYSVICDLNLCSFFQLHVLVKRQSFFVLNRVVQTP